MRIIWLVLLLLFYVPLVYLITVNWHDDKIRDIGFSILMVAGVVGLVSVWNALKEEKSYDEFIVSVVVPIKDSSKQLVHMKWKDDMFNKRYFPPFPDNFNLAYVAQEYSQAFPEEFNKDIWVTYKDVIGYNILDMFYQNFKMGWLFDQKKIESELGPTTATQKKFEQENSKTFKWEDVTKNLEPAVYKIELLRNSHSKHGITTPVGVDFKVFSNASDFIIQLNSKFSKIKISLVQQGSTKGFGRSGYYIGLSKEDYDNYYTYNYSLSIESEIKKAYSGSKESENHRIWFNTINTLLKENFDFSVYLGKLKEWKELSKQ